MNIEELYQNWIGMATLLLAQGAVNRIACSLMVITLQQILSTKDCVSCEKFILAYVSSKFPPLKINPAAIR